MAVSFVSWCPLTACLWPCQVFLTTGVIVGVVQLVVFPRAIKVFNITTWQRVGCVMAVPAFFAVPYTKDVSWNERSLFVLSVASMTLVYCFMSMVSQLKYQTGYCTQLGF